MLNAVDESSPSGSPPGILYKYTSWDNASEKDAFRYKILTVPQINFAAPSSFNDPFDCQLSFGLDAKSDEEIFEYLRAKFAEDKDSIEWAELQLKSNREQYLADIDTVLQQKIELQSGVFCLSEDPLNSLLWAHYASGHRGICVGYDTQSLIRHLDCYGSEPELITDHLSVEYRELLPRLEPFLEDNREWFLQMYRFKARDWSYEQEYRLVLIKHESLTNRERTVEISAECLSEVILGCKADNNTESEIRIAVDKLRSSNPNVRIMRAVKSKIRFEYELIEL